MADLLLSCLLTSCCNLYALSAAIVLVLVPVFVVVVIVVGRGEMETLLETWLAFYHVCGWHFHHVCFRVYVGSLMFYM